MITLHWNELAITTTKEAEEIVANILNEHGANGVVIDDATDLKKKHRELFGELYELDETKFPQKGVRIKAYFQDDQTWEHVFSNIQHRLEQLRITDSFLTDLTVSVQKVFESDWENEWKKYYTIQKVTDSIVIVPNWETYEKTNEEDIVIKMDPGMAFGTGDHPTTILSLLALERTLQPKDVVIDVGTGSGILSVASALLGAKKVYAYDLDPVAVRSATENTLLNDVQAIVTASENDLLRGITHKANIVVANILADIIIDLVQDAERVLIPGGYFITSGIIDKKANEVYRKLRQYGFSIITKNERDRWVSFIAKKKE